MAALSHLASQILQRTYERRIYIPFFIPCETNNVRAYYADGIDQQILSHHVYRRRCRQFLLFIFAVAGRIQNWTNNPILI